MSDLVTGNGHDDLNTAILRVEAYLERLEKVTERLEQIGTPEQDDK